MTTPSNTPSFPTPTEVPKLWGRELILWNSPDYCAKYLDFRAGTRGSLHWHALKREGFHVLTGRIEFTWVDTATAARRTRVLGPGDQVDIPRQCPHQVYALEDTRVLEVSTQDFAEDSYRVEASTASAPLEGWKS